MGNIFGKFFQVITWGESHGKAIGVVINGCPSNVPICVKDIQKDLDRRRPNQSDIVTKRMEEDKVEILSGIFEGFTLGTPISLIVWNHDQRSRDYSSIKDIFRPGHADYSYFKKYGHYDYRGGGRSSARETVSRVSAGAIAKIVLNFFCKNVKVYAYTLSIGSIKAKNIVFSDIELNQLRTADKHVVEDMKKEIIKAKEEKTSIGGVVEICILNIPEGLGDPVFDKLDAKLSQGIMSIGGVKGIEFGSGFSHQFMKGHQSNDPFNYKDGKFITDTNHSGGILGGISTGMPIIMRVVIKAPSSISGKQKTVDVYGKERFINIQGRHDPCILPRIVPIIESMVYIILCDFYLSQRVHNLK